MRPEKRQFRSYPYAGITQIRLKGHRLSGLYLSRLFRLPQPISSWPARRFLGNRCVFALPSAPL